MSPTHVGAGWTFACRLRRWIGPLAAAALVLWPAGFASAQQTGRVTGAVVDGASGAPLAGAQVVIEGTETGTITNGQGRYMLLNVPAGTHTVAIVLIGYGRETAEVSVGAGQTVTTDFDVFPQAIALEGVVATGTPGQARRREVGNSIAQISAQEIAAAPIMDVGDVLQGRAAGVTVRDLGGGQAGAGSTISLRGVNTIEGARPLIYVDGIRLEQGTHGSPDEANVVATALDDLDPNSIARVEIVKGAAATTLYGTEAAAGVIQIFTKRGGGGEPAWTFSMEQGFSNIGHVGPEEDPTGLHLNDCSMDPGCPASGTWFRNGHIQEYNLAVSGGGDLNYYASASWGSEEGVIAPQGASDMSLRANFTFKPFESVTISANNMFSRRDIRWLPSGNNAEGFLLNVMRGETDYTPDHDDSTVLDMELDQMIDHFITGANITWIPVDGMLHRINVGMDYSTSDYTEERPWGFYSVPEGNREADIDGDRNITIDYAGNWNTDLPVADLASTLSWGAQYYDEFSWGAQSFGEEFAGPGAKLVQSGVETDGTESWQRIASGGLFLQEMIGWQDRLFITAGGRWDGFSTFGEDFGIAFYPKLAAAYTISDHAFWPAWWETMKLRAAVGVSGRAPGAFDRSRTWSSISGDTRQPGIILANYGNDEIGPELTREIEVGFEGSVLDGRVSFDFTYFDQNTSDALFDRTIPPSSGTEQEIPSNLGELINRGFELAANASILRTPDFSWDLGGNFATANNKVLQLGTVPDPRRLGRPIDAIFGDVVINGDEVGVDPIFEEQYLGPVVPTLTWGLNTRLTVLRRLTLDLLGEAQTGHVHEASIARQGVARDYWAPCNYVFDAINAGDTSQLTARELGRCDPDQVTYGMWTTPGDFFKLRSVSLGYRVPENLLPGAASGMTIRLMGRNLLTVTDYPGLDPELAEGGADRATGGDFGSFEYYDVPPARQFLLNVTVNF